jgi:hypothetical protein
MDSKLPYLVQFWAITAKFASVFEGDLKWIFLPFWIKLAYIFLSFLCSNYHIANVDLARKFRFLANFVLIPLTILFQLLGSISMIEKKKKSGKTLAVIGGIIGAVSLLVKLLLCARIKMTKTGKEILKRVLDIMKEKADDKYRFERERQLRLRLSRAQQELHELKELKKTMGNLENAVGDLQKIQRRPSLVQVGENFFTENPTKEQREAHLKEMLKHNDNEDFCIICFGNLSCIMMRPCRHAGFCKECAESMLKKKNRCPMCRQKVSQYVQYYKFNKSYKPLKVLKLN